jgi:hypothetical protein
MGARSFLSSFFRSKKLRSSPLYVVILVLSCGQAQKSRVSMGMFGTYKNVQNENIVTCIAIIRCDFGAYRQHPKSRVSMGMFVDTKMRKTKKNVTCIAIVRCDFGACGQGRSCSRVHPVDLSATPARRSIGDYVLKLL